jgi:hypothetical protein
LLDHISAFTVGTTDRGFVVLYHGHHQGEFLVAFLAAVFVGWHGSTPIESVDKTSFKSVAANSEAESLFRSSGKRRDMVKNIDGEELHPSIIPVKLNTFSNSPPAIGIMP